MKGRRELRIFGAVTGTAVALLALIASLTMDELLPFGFDCSPASWRWP